MKRLRFAEWVALLGAVTLLVTLFLDWFRVEGPGAQSLEAAANTTGWTALGWVTVALLVICIVCAVALFVLTLAGAGDALTLPPGVVLGFVGPFALLVLIVVVLFQPGLGLGLPNDRVAMEPAGWIGLMGAFAMLLGGLASLRDERTTGPDRVAAKPDARPAPPAGRA